MRRTHRSYNGGRDCDGAGPKISLLMLRLVNDVRDVLEFVFSPHILQDPLQCLRQSYFAPTHRQVDLYNSICFKQSMENNVRTWLPIV